MRRAWNRDIAAVPAKLRPGRRFGQLPIHVLGVGSHPGPGSAALASPTAPHLLWFRRQVLRRIPLGRSGVRQLIHVAAKSRALVVAGQDAIVLQFAPQSPWHGLTLSLRPQISYQL